MTPTSLLFVPASRPERFVKASQSDAKAYIIDLEDTISDSDKEVAREYILAYDGTNPMPFWVRINGANSAFFDDDLACVMACRHLAGIVLPKAETADNIKRTNIGKPIIGVIETAFGMANLPCLAKSGKMDNLFALGFGILDLGKQLGITQGSRSAQVLFDRLRCDMVLHSAANGLNSPIETIFPHIQNTDGLAMSAKYAYEMGFGGQFAIHPSQLSIINHAYTPYPATHAFAQAVLDYHNRTGEMVFVIEGQMVDLPLIDWAKSLLDKHTP